jgi:hypothetical protein
MQLVENRNLYAVLASAGNGKADTPLRCSSAASRAAAAGAAIRRCAGARGHERRNFSNCAAKWSGTGVRASAFMQVLALATFDTKPVKCLTCVPRAILSRPVALGVPAYRAQCVARRLQRESARMAPVGELRHRGPAQRTAEEHGEDGADVQPLRGRDVRRERLGLPKGGPVCQT